jgi:hypothetical protein
MGCWIDGLLAQWSARPNVAVFQLSINPALYSAYGHKKTGLVDQGVTEKPGEFSNLVLSGMTEYISLGEY